MNQKLTILQLNILVGFFAAASAFATSGTWTGTGVDNLFVNAANWSASPAPTNTADVATFDGSGNNTKATAGININTTIGGPTGSSSIGSSLALSSGQTSAVLITNSSTSAFWRLNTNGISVAAGAGPLTFDNFLASAGRFQITLGGSAAGANYPITNNNSSGVNPITFGTNVVFISGSGTRTVAIGGPGDVIINGRILSLSTTSSGSVVKSGTGTLTLAGDSTITNGLTSYPLRGITLNAGTLNINNAGALGTNDSVNGGIFTINGGTIGNTSGNDIAIKFPVPQIWGGDFTYAGTSSLDLSNGAVTLSASRVVTVNANTLTVGGVISGSGFSLTKAGNGTLVLSGVNIYTGATTNIAGTLLVNGSTAAGSAVFVTNAILGGTGTINGALTLANGATLQPTLLGAVGTLTLASATAPTFAATGTLKIRVPTTTTADQVALSSTTPVFACGNLNLVIDANGLAAGSAFTTPAIVSVAKTSGGITGPFAGVTVVNNAGGYTPTVNYNAQTITVTMASGSPGINTSGTLSAFTTTYGTPSAPQSVAVSGSSLVANLVATAPTGFEVSSDGTTYGNTATFTPTSGSASGTLYVRLAASATVSGSYNSQNIVVSSSGATSVSIATTASGNAVSAATPTVTPSWSVGTNFTYISSGQGPTLTSVSTSPHSMGTTNVTYLGVSGTTYASSVNAPTNAGSYSVTVTIGSDANYNSATASENFGINQTNLTVASQPNTKLYDGTTGATNKPTITAGILQGSDVATLKEVYRNTLVGAGKPLVPSIAITNAGVNVLANYNVTLVTNSTGVIQATTSLLLTNNIGETNNYGQTFVFTAVVQTNGVTVSGASSNVVFSLGSTPVWTNALVNGLAYFTNNSLTVGVTNFTAQYLGDITYVGSSVTVTQTVLQTTPTLTVTSSNITYGATLVNSLLTDSVATNANNQAGVVGSFAFTTPGIVPNAGTTNVWVIFTPTDTTNYTTSSNTVNVTVNQASTFVGATSTNNPSGYKDPVAFTATLPAFASGDVVFSYTNGPISTNGLSSGSATSLSITNLPRGTNLITVAYLGDSNYAGSTNTLNQVVTNHPPVAAVMTVTRTAGLALIIALSDIATNWTDSDSDHVSLTGVTMQSTNGVNLFPLNWNTNLDGSIETTNTYAYIGYTNSPNVADQISYTISDGFGGTNIGYVNIVIQTSVTGTNSISGHDFTSPYSNTITAYGIPNFFYVLERATNLTSPVWVDVQTNQAATNGVINSADTFWDLGGVKPSPSAFYQLKWQP